MTIVESQRRVELSFSEYSRRLDVVLKRNPDLTIAELAKKICKSESWIRNRLSLNKLDNGIKKLLDSGSIPFFNAFLLAELSIEDQLLHVDDAMNMSPTAFAQSIKRR